jgi:gliding motility-associated-like protein
VNVSFALPPLQIADPATVTYPATVDLSQSFAAQPNVSYSYFRDVQTTQPLVNFTAVATSGTYYIKAEGNLGCANIQPINVTILPPESFSVTTPNTFTPNNDGINDQFLIAFNGYISFGRLQIYNRNGALMFDTTKAGQFWDGNYNGRPVSTGTYYWVFEGYDNYYHKKVSRSSFITLIR